MLRLTMEPGVACEVSYGAPDTPPDDPDRLCPCPVVSALTLVVGRPLLDVEPYIHRVGHRDAGSSQSALAEVGSRGDASSLQSPQGMCKVTSGGGLGGGEAAPEDIFCCVLAAKPPKHNKNEGLGHSPNDIAHALTMSRRLFHPIADMW